MIEEQVLDAIGKLDNLKEVRVAKLFENRYRVNVWCTYKPEGCITDFDGQKIDYSYFIRADDKGKITYCNPEIGTKSQTKFTVTKLPFRDN